AVQAMTDRYSEGGARTGERVEDDAVAPCVVAAVCPAEGLALSSGGTAARSGDRPDVPGADAVSVPVAPCPSADRFADGVRRHSDPPRRFPALGAHLAGAHRLDGPGEQRFGPGGVMRAL